MGNRFLEVAKLGEISLSANFDPPFPSPPPALEGISSVAAACYWNLG